MSCRFRRAVRLGICLVGLVLLAGCHGARESSSGVFHFTNATKPGSVIPADKRKPVGPVAGELLTGGTYALSQDAGHVTVVNMFTSWCGPCQLETPQLDAVYRRLAPAGVRVVGFDVKDMSQGAARSWLRMKQISFPIVWDQKFKVGLQLGDVPAYAIPETVVVDKHGRAAAVYLERVLPADLDPVLDQLTAES
ncbi:MAG: Alkyl hydroperoxide reductase/Thiol specific antioxidant [Frankiales bacterium]|nr:Alkyl hydroperoxide reductase/Thiol specific antioxidant [Frankiales bacterium]